MQVKRIFLLSSCQHTHIINTLEFIVTLYYKFVEDRREPFIAAAIIT